MGRLFARVLFGVLMPLAGAAVAQEYRAAEILVSNPWSRATPPAAPVAGGYVTITNSGSEPDRLLSMESTRAAKVELHQSTIIEGVARMRPITGGLKIAAGETVSLQPGGSHVMFVKPDKPFVEGERVRARLSFERAGVIEVEFRVQRMGANSPAPDTHKGHGAPQ